MSRFLYDTKTLFLHIPRTGGTFVEKVFQECGIRCSRWASGKLIMNRLPQKHALLGHYKRERLAEVEKKFAFVRHPLSYYRSVWGWLCRSEGRGLGNHNWHPFQEVTRYWHPQYSVWLNQVLKYQPGWYSALVRDYVGPAGGEFVQFIGRTESLVIDLQNVLSLVGMEQEKLERIQGVMRRMEKVNTSEKPAVDERSEEILQSEREVVNRFYQDNQHLRFYCPMPS